MDLELHVREGEGAQNKNKGVGRSEMHYGFKKFRLPDTSVFEI